MIQFSKPRRTLAKSMDQFRRHETNARDYIAGSAGAGPMSEGTVPGDTVIGSSTDVTYCRPPLRHPQSFRRKFLPDSRCPRLHPIRRAVPPLPGDVLLRSAHVLPRWPLRPRRRWHPARGQWREAQHLRQLRVVGHLAGRGRQQRHGQQQRRRDGQRREQYRVLAERPPARAAHVVRQRERRGRERPREPLAVRLQEPRRRGRHGRHEEPVRRDAVGGDCVLNCPRL
ncbi:hypothetical protein B0H10DRAFT_862915 [Mycena sp. CBHHK59/15]|nr:hypothetical protein B0H10DRAFT_862915 [Mycena sp. CBHHK59/15]